jgi:hypothetical protein
LKELNYQKVDGAKGSISLSLLSTDFKDLKKRLLLSGIFEDVFELNEVHPSNFKVNFKYENLRGKYNPMRVFANWILQWRYIARQTEEFINIDFSNYQEIFVYCDSDPIGMFLNYKKITYTAVEDGLESIRLSKIEKESKFVMLKIILSKLGLMFMKDGHSKYAKAVEVNSENNLYSFGRKIIGESRQELLNRLTNFEKEKIYKVFFEGGSIRKFNNKKRNAMLLAGQLCSTQKSFDIYRDIIKEYCNGYNIYIKPHPIDSSDYQKEFPKCIVLERFFPIEIFNIKCELSIDKLVSVTSVLDQHTFANEKIRLGIDFLDKYQDPEMLYQPK